MLSAGEADGDLILVSWVPDEQEPVRLQAQRAWTEITALLDANGAIPLHERVFGSLSVAPCVMSARKAVAHRRCEELRLMPAFVEGLPLDEGCGGLAGIHVVAARAADGRADWIETDGRPCGRIVEARGARFLSFSDLGPTLPPCVAPDAAGEAAASMERAEAALAATGWSFGDVCRTWLHVFDAPEWNRTLDAARRTKVASGPPSADGASTLPATTGTGGRSLRGGRCSLDLLAARRNASAPFERRVVRDARPEGSASGVCLDLGESRYVFVSGTASTDASGVLLDAGDFRSQALRVLENVVALLESQGAGLDDVRQATAFVKRPEDADDFRCLAEVCGLWEVPVITVRGEMRPEELLFELDATAAVPAHRLPLPGDPR
jgi:enamine deaminase RidA (YjgF/YER057c/UK114 family)